MLCLKFSIYLYGSLHTYVLSIVGEIKPCLSVIVVHVTIKLFESNAHLKPLAVTGTRENAVKPL